MITKIMRFYIPGFIKRKKLRELFSLTADAFQSEVPELGGLSFDSCLSEYALFTKEQTERCIQSGCSLEEVKHRLYQNSYIMGQNLGQRFHIKNREEAVTVLGIIYKLIGIDFQCDGQSEFTIKHCFFSKFYSNEVCKVISSMDEGLAAGLSGDRLSFYQRITDGASCCKGYLSGGF